MIKSIFLIIILIFFSFNLNAQNNTIEHDASRQNLISNNGMISSFDMNNTTVKGTPYILNEFMPGKVLFEEQTQIFNVRYNAFNDVVEVKKDNGDLDALNKELTGITITLIKDKKSYRAYNYIDSKTGENKSGYFVIASNSPKPLLVKEKIVFKDKQKAKSGYDKARPAEYKRKDDLYFTLNEKGIAIELPSNKKELAKTFPKHTKDVLSFIKANKIKTSKQNDLIRLLNYINTL
ncbi:hypothetical protein [Psychroserpens sp.]|uniref:hypothetical protein n=1 Tax=Psychroserpens sp. TaxID=2020870 RepID=UPI00385E0399